MDKIINIYGDIVPFKWCDDGFEFDMASLNDAVTKANFQDKDNLLVNIHTYGGCTTTAFAIYNKLLNLKTKHNLTITTRVDGYCASSGVILLLLGDKRIGNAYAEPFIHNAWTWTQGNKADHQKQYEDLQRVDNQIASLYAERTNISKEDALELMDADGYVTAEKALEYGFYTEIENVNTSAENSIFNSITTRNKQTRTVINKSNMSKNDEDVDLNKMDKGKLKQLFNALGDIFKPKGVKNIIVKTADQKELDFYEREDGEPVIGDKAKIDGSDANGEFVIAKNDEDSETYVFENGTLTEIKTDDVEDEEVENLKKQLDEANAKVQELESNVTNLKADKKDFETKYNTINEKHTALNNKLNETYNSIVDVDPNAEPKGGEPEKMTMAEIIKNKKK